MTNAENGDDLPPNDARRWGFIALLLMIPVYSLLTYFFSSGLARAGAASFGIMVLIVRIFWDLRYRAWFWITIAFLSLLHVVAIAIIPWSNKDLAAPLLWPAGFADYFAIYGCIKSMQRLTQIKHN